MNAICRWWRGELPIYVAIALFLIAILATLLNSSELGPKEVGPAVLSMFGTFLGALLAFRLQQRKEQEADELEKVELLNRALIVLCLQYNDLAVWMRTLDQYQRKLERMINLPAERASDKFDPRQNVESLAFLIDHGHAQLILDLAIEQGRFDGAHTAIAERCRVVVTEMQPALERHKLNNREITERQVRDALGDLLFGVLETATNQVYEHVSLTVDSLKKCIDDLHNAAKGIYPHRTFVKIAQ